LAVSRKRKLLAACNLIDVIRGNVITPMHTYMFVTISLSLYLHKYSVVSL